VAYRIYITQWAPKLDGFVQGVDAANDSDFTLVSRFHIKPSGLHLAIIEEHREIEDADGFVIHSLDDDLTPEQRSD
jgi:hypothetical protein